METIGEKIKSIRKQNNLTQTEFAKSLGISQTHISKIEKNIEIPSNQLLTFISYRYCANLDWLNGKTDKMELDFGLEREHCINRFNSLRLEIEKNIKMCSTDTIIDIVDTFFYFTKTILPCCDKKNETIDIIKQIYMLIWSVSNGGIYKTDMLIKLLKELEQSA